jgi:concanavalin A-like lectin/glucanase superfamily protein/F5/8 type C domain-containing protein
MGKKLMVLTLCAFVASMMAGPVVYASDPTLIGWWKLDEGAGTTVLDSSGQGNNGTFGGAPEWVEDMDRGMAVSFGGSALIDTPVIIPAMTLENGFTWAFWCKQAGDGAGVNNVIFGNRYGGTASPLQFIKFTPTNFEYYYGAHAGTIAYENVPADEWVHMATVKDGANLQHYRNGVATESNTTTAEIDENPFSMGGDATNGAEYWTGMLSDGRLYSRALTDGEILDVMAGKGPNAELADNPVPESETIDVPRDVVLAWEAGEFAATHDVYLGTVLDDVNNASRADAMGVLVSQGQTDAAYASADVLEFGQTYYWRVDEVNAAPDTTIFKGEIWSFEVEPFAYPIEGIVATCNAASEEGVGPERTVDGSGLDADGAHSTTTADMWLTLPGGADPVQLSLEFDQVYKLHQMLVWNYNSMFESVLGFGLKDVTVEYSVDGVEWVLLGDVEVAQATTMAGYTANTTVDFGGVAAQYVRLTVNSGYGMLGQYGLSEVQIMYIPSHAREPQPADGATDVSIETMFGWRAGRDAVSHEVSFGTDPEALALADTVSGTSTTPGTLDLSTTYYWQVTAVQDAESWASRVWGFTTEDYVVVDDFESYDDEDNVIYETWADGWVNETGSTVGYLSAPFAEQTIVNSGFQSMPLSYDNAGLATAEAELALAQDWTASGIQSLSLSFYGAPENTGQLYVKINDTKVAYDGDAADIANAAWQVWNIDLSAVGGNLSSVTSLTIGVEGAGAVGVVYIDDIRVVSSSL